MRIEDLIRLYERRYRRAYTFFSAEGFSLVEIHWQDNHGKKVEDGTEISATYSWKPARG